MRSLMMIALLFCPSMLFAADAPCKMTENANVNVSFNSIENDIESIQPKFDAKVKEIEALGKQLKLDKLETQSLSYNVYPQNNGGGSTQYQFNGNVSFNVLPAKKATDLMVLLTKKGYQVNLNVNAYREGNMCNRTNMAD